MVIQENGRQIVRQTWRFSVTKQTNCVTNKQRTQLSDYSYQFQLSVHNAGMHFSN